MILPMRRLSVVTNANDILTRLWKMGTYAKVNPVSVLEDVKETRRAISNDCYLAYQTTPHDDLTRQLGGWQQ